MEVDPRIERMLHKMEETALRSIYAHLLGSRCKWHQVLMITLCSILAQRFT